MIGVMAHLSGIEAMADGDAEASQAFLFPPFTGGWGRRPLIDRSGGWWWGFFYFILHNFEIRQVRSR